MKQTNHKHTDSSGSLSNVFLNHSYSVNSSSPKFALQGVALNSSRQVLSTVQEETQNKPDNQNRASLQSYKKANTGRVLAGHRDNQEAGSLESKSELQSLEINMQTSILPAVFHNRLSSRNSDEKNEAKVCELYSEKEFFKRHLNLADLRRQQRGKTNKIQERVDIKLLHTENGSEIGFKKETTESLCRYSSKQKTTSALMKRRKDERKTQISFKNGKKALHCTLSRNKASNSPVNQDLDYQYYDLKDLEAFIIDGNHDNAIDLVARENSDACGTIFPPLSANKCRLKHRYVSEFNGSPSTPLLREYTRISNYKLTEF